MGHLLLCCSGRFQRTTQIPSGNIHQVCEPAAHPLLSFQWLHLQPSLQDHLELLISLCLLQVGSAAFSQH